MPTSNFPIIGIGGTNGSGKDTLAFMLAQRHGWMVVSVSEFLRDEARHRGLPIERENLRGISAEWRRQYGHGVLTEKAVEEFKKQSRRYKGLVVTPMRHPGEAQAVKQLGGKVVWVDADPKIRYQRIAQRQRSAEDKKTYQQFLAEEQAEMQNSGDAATLSMSKVKAMADVFLENSGGDVEEFKNQAEQALGLA